MSDTPWDKNSPTTASSATRWATSSAGSNAGATAPSGSPSTRTARWVGRYDPHTNMTWDAQNNLVGYGNLLASLIGRR